VVHALSIDVEDWYHGAPMQVATTGSRVERNTRVLLDLLQAHDQRATFCFLGEVVARFPALARRVAADGHEIGSHGYRHDRVTALTRREFRDDVTRSLRVIEDATGRPVHGYRAPCFSIKADVRWPLDILAAAGVRYDASILASDRPPGLELVCPRRPYRHANGLWEVPVGILQVLHFWHLPLASGTGLRLLPPWMLERWIRRFERDVGAAVFYLHPWEIDPHSPTVAQPWRWLARHNRGRLPRRLDRLLARRRFGAIAEVFRDVVA
jgi:polysaccharide deacetylase family protein (PEP-CTERM system associated)